jgi:hypothetical protein
VRVVLFFYTRSHSHRYFPDGAVNVGSSSDGVAGLVKTVMASDEAKAIGNAILEGVLQL